MNFHHQFSDNPYLNSGTYSQWKLEGHLVRYFGFSTAMLGGIPKSYWMQLWSQTSSVFNSNSEDPQETGARSCNNFTTLKRKFFLF